MAAFAFGLLALGVKMKELQVDGVAAYQRENAQQSSRSVRESGSRGLILDRCGRVLAGNRSCVSVMCRVDAFRRRGVESTVAAVTAAVARVARQIGLPCGPSARAVRRHVLQSPLLPLEVWRDIDEKVVAQLSERAEEFPGFDLNCGEARVYPFGSLAAHTLGYVGLARETDSSADFAEREPRGREGLERYYDSFLRGVAGERQVVVDSRGFAVKSRVVREPRSGPSLRLTLDMEIQRAVERELVGERGACAVIDPRDGSVLALASAPGYDPNSFIPTLSASLYTRLVQDPAKPLLNRAVAGQYAPGSTFKPVTALAALRLGVPASTVYDCAGVYECGGMRIRCARRWGHGSLSLAEALRDSCNVYFCQLAADIGTNALFAAARDLGLGSRTGLDFPDKSGIVPGAEWKLRTYGEPWYTGDLLQMSIGQGMLLVTPLQMALVAGAVGTGRLVRPHLNADSAPESRQIPFAADHLDAVRAGMRAVVEKKGTGWRGAEDVGAWMLGKTGTAEVGAGERRRKNTWFIAYAETCAFNASGEIVRAAPTARTRVVAIAMVVENGLSGGGTTAPKVAAILRRIFGRASRG